MEGWLEGFPSHGGLPRLSVCEGLDDGGGSEWAHWTAWHDIDNVLQGHDRNRQMASP